MFSINFCNPWVGNSQLDGQGLAVDQSAGNTTILRKKNILDSITPSVTGSRMSTTIKDIKAEMTQAKLRESLPIKLNDLTRQKLVGAERVFGGVSIEDLEDYTPTASRTTGSGTPQESQALREILFSLQILDFPLTEDDTFLIVNMLHRQDALSPSDLKGIFSAFGREAVDMKSFASKTAQFMNTANLPEPLLFEAASGFVDIANKRHSTRMSACLTDLCTQLDQDVRNKMQNYLLSYHMLNPANISVSLKRPPGMNPQENAPKAASSNTAVNQSSASNRSITRVPMKPVTFRQPHTDVKPLRNFYPRPQQGKVQLNY